MRLTSFEEARALPGWREGFSARSKDHRYYEILADTLGSQFAFQALVIESPAGEVCAVQPCFLVTQDLVATAPEFVRGIVAALRRLLPRSLRLRMLMLGCAAGEGELAITPAFLPELGKRLPAIAAAEGASLIVWKDFPAVHRPTLRVLAPSFPRVPSMPATRLPLTFSSFDDYLTQRLSHAMRKNLRRKFKSLAGAAPITLQVRTSVEEVVDEAYALYLQVYERSTLRFERLTKEFLLELGRRMPERVRFFTWEQEGRLIAFSVCLVHDGVLYDEYLGLDYRVAFDLHLYFVTFRDVLSWAIAQGLREYRSTPLNYEPKLHLGFELAPLDLYVAPTRAWLAPLMRAALPFISPTRGEAALRKFRNADEL